MNELKNYESVIILTPVLSDEQMKETVKKYRELITEHDGEVVNEENWGLTKLAYPVQKKTTGFYQIFEFRAKNDFVKTLEVNYKRDERILRFLTVALDKHGVIYNERKRRGEFNTTKPGEVKSKTKKVIAEEVE